MANIEKAYKILHEQFVSGHNGTSVLDIGLTVTSAPLAVLLHNILITFVPGLWRNTLGAKVLYDMMTLVLPVLLCFTVLADYTIATLSGMLLVIFIIPITKGSFKQPKGHPVSWNIIANTAITGRRPYITNFRAYVNIATAISILAVDFSIYPRRFCKSETYGTGLMDVGVGAFIIANGIVSHEAKPHFQRHKPFSIKDSLRGVYNCVLSCLPLLLLGILRLISVKATNYQEHVSEYGVHWNFFFTLALVKLLCSLVLCLFSPRLSWLICLAVSSGYQYVLTGRNVTQFVLLGDDGHGSREGFINANREGLLSSIGYVALYFAGVQLGSYLLQPRNRFRDWIWVFITLVLIDVGLWFLLDYTEANLQPVSRRMANLPFIIWMMAYNIQLLASFLLVDLVTIVLKEFGYIPMNYMSIVNLSVSTIHVSPPLALVILFLYMLLLSSIAAMLHYHDITLKWW